MKFPQCQYNVILADNPWDYELYSDKGKGRSPHAHYDCMTQEQMLAMRDQILFAANSNSVLIMWTVFPAKEGKDFLLDALELMRHWGFQRKAGGVWVKRDSKGGLSMGTGWMLRGNAELFLIGTHGSPRIKNKKTKNVLLTGDWPDRIEDIDNIVLDSQRREHSRKPDEMYELIEALFDGPYLELFARTKRPGWDSWGNEVGKFTTETPHE